MLTVGATEEERKADEESKATFTKDFGCYQRYWQKWFELALQLKAADIYPDEVLGEYDNYAFVIVKDKKIINQYGETLVDLSNDEDLKNASFNIVKKLLISSYNEAF